MSHVLKLALLGLLALPATAAAHGPPAVTGGPTGATKERSAEFVISYDEFVVNQKFECKLDEQEWKPCTDDTLPEGKAVYTDLSEGPHTFQARRVDSGPAPDPSADDTPSDPRKWTVDTTGPKTSITSLAAGADTTVSFAAGEEGATFECSLDGAAFAACTSPLSLTGLAPGEHALKIRGVDALGNVAAEPVQVTWTVPAPPAPAAPAAPVAPVTPAAPALQGLPAGTMPLLTVGKKVKRPSLDRCAGKRTKKQRAACRKAARRKAAKPK
jgi:hypothetical protein